MHQDATWSGDRPQPRRLCVRWCAFFPEGIYTSEKRHTHPQPIFGPCLLWPNGWMDEDATWYRSRPRLRPHYIRRGPSYPRKGHSCPLFSAHVYCGHGRPSQLLLSSCQHLTYPTCISLHLSFAEILGTGKLESLGYRVALLAV